MSRLSLPRIVWAAILLILNAIALLLDAVKSQYVRHPDSAPSDDHISIAPVPVRGSVWDQLEHSDAPY
ncbi:hypothetical protein FHL15_010736 [Xylaria flabelliformis]|uniref:Uncharacterized protein n=1 Tax=Xylaria flabelliformis TaxID=2512241 RepID=A0A553HK88_9PEZI|nr:hypothetical protein FHL15_010736 [Xylaria flabelliformis]